MDFLDQAANTNAQLAVVFIPLILYSMGEFVYLVFIKKTHKNKEYGQLALNFWLFIGLGTIVGGILSVFVFASIGLKFAPWTSGLEWYWFIYAFVVYEFWYWIQHWLAHKVRLFWTIHSTHHAPQSMSMAVGFEHNFVEAFLYFPFFFGFVTALCGVNPVFIIIINIIDATYGNLLHISDGVMKNGRYGIIGKFMQTPSLHRVHHATNVKYMDMNYNSITQLWDRIMGTLQPLDDQEPVRYGITRDVDTGSFFDMQFGDIRLLVMDVWKAPGLKNKLGYIFKPPGWSHDGNHVGLVSELKKAAKL